MTVHCERLAAYWALDTLCIYCTMSCVALSSRRLPELSGQTLDSNTFDTRIAIYALKSVSDTNQLQIQTGPVIAQHQCL